MRKFLYRTAVFNIELSQPLHPLTNLQKYSFAQIYILFKGQLLGKVRITNFDHTISVSRLGEAIINEMSEKLVENSGTLNDLSNSNRANAILKKYLICTESNSETVKLSDEIPVSIVVATLDRPDDLRECLKGLQAQITKRCVEIVVVDNNPGSGLTPPVVAEFPEVVLVNEPREGLAYARNAGFIASKGDIYITTDDDVKFPSNWLEKLIAPFSRNDVMAVTGNVLPFELESRAQNTFEDYGGLGRGFERVTYDGRWLESNSLEAAYTWNIGATANAAFRATVFNHPDIGLMEETLGPGMPSGVGEDTYLFYRILKADYTIIYEPTAYVRHKHRSKMSTLRRQIYNYSKGHIAYLLTTAIRDGDMRGLTRIAVVLPGWRLKQIYYCLCDRKKNSFLLILIEIIGNLVGPWALWRSYQRVKREGRSDPKTSFSYN